MATAAGDMAWGIGGSTGYIHYNSGSSNKDAPITSSSSLHPHGAGQIMPAVGAWGVGAHGGQQRGFGQELEWTAMSAFSYYHPSTTTHHGPFQPSPPMPAPAAAASAPVAAAAAVAPVLVPTVTSAFSRGPSHPGRKRPRFPSFSSPPTSGAFPCPPSPASSTGQTTTDAEVEVASSLTAARKRVWRPTPPAGNSGGGGKDALQLSPLTDSSGQFTPPSLLREEEAAGRGRSSSSSSSSSSSLAQVLANGEAAAMMEVGGALSSLMQLQQQPEELESLLNDDEEEEDEWEAAVRWLGAIGVMDVDDTLPDTAPQVAAAAAGGAAVEDEEELCAGWAAACEMGLDSDRGFDWASDPAFRPWSSQSAEAAAMAAAWKAAEAAVGEVGFLGLGSAGEGGSAFERLRPSAAAGGRVVTAGGEAPVAVAEWDWPHARLQNQETTAAAAAAAAGPAVLDEASVQPNPKVYGVCLARRTLGERELRVSFGSKLALPDFLGMGPDAVVPTYEELLAQAGRRL